MTNYRNDPIIGTRYFNYRKHGLRKETDNYVKLLIEIGNMAAIVLQFYNNRGLFSGLFLAYLRTLYIYVDNRH